MRSVALAACAYALAVFAVGFMLGAVRVLLVVPRIGEIAAVLAELPIMLTASFLIARWAVKRWQVPGMLGPRVSMGAIGFAILMACEVVVSVAIFENTLGLHFAHYLKPQAWLGLSGQLVFAAMPALLLGAGDRQ